MPVSSSTSRRAFSCCARREHETAMDEARAVAAGPLPNFRLRHLFPLRPGSLQQTWMRLPTASLTLITTSEANDPLALRACECGSKLVDKRGLAVGINARNGGMTRPAAHPPPEPVHRLAQP